MAHSSRGRFSSDALSWPLWLRAAVTVPICIVAYFLGRTLLVGAAWSEPATALVIPVFGIYSFYAGLILRAVWRSNDSWRNEQARTDAHARQVRDLVERQAAAAGMQQEAAAAAIQASAGQDAVTPGAAQKTDPPL